MESAIDRLIVGDTDRQVASAVGINRSTVWKWRSQHAYFVAELNRRRQNLWGASVERLRAMLPRALDRVEEELDSGEDGFRAAVTVLRLAGVESLPPPGGPVDAEQIINTMVDKRLAEKYDDPIAEVLNQMDGGKREAQRELSRRHVLAEQQEITE